MDNKTIFVRTSKGDEAAQSRTSPLPGDVKRALLMVDGSATLGEISKRAAPSIRATLGEMLQELEKSGFIEAKAIVSNTPRVSLPPPGMVIPTKVASAQKKQPSDDVSELDFMSGKAATPSNAALAEARAKEAQLEKDRAEKLRIEAEEKIRLQLAAEKIRVRQEAQAILIKAEQEAARIHEETVRRARAEAEATRQKAEQEARKIREELEAAQLKAAREAELRIQAATRERKQAEAVEAARLQAEQQAAQIRLELEAARLHAEEAAKASLEAAAQAHARKAEEAVTQAKEAAELINKVLREDDLNIPVAIATTRSTSGTVLFFDVVEYTKQSVIKQIEIKRQFNQIVSGCLKTRGVGEHIILDTGDGAAIGFLQHPEDALEVALNFRQIVTANQHLDYPDMKVRIGIHLGPINITKDMNGQSNMVGDGINDAQRIMSFAAIDQIYISRAYYDFVSRLNDEYAVMFKYRGSQEDKHGREHSVYELVDATSETGLDQPAAEVMNAEIPAIKVSGNTEAAPVVLKSDAFAFDAFQIEDAQRAIAAPTDQEAAPLIEMATPAGHIEEIIPPTNVQPPPPEQQQQSTAEKHENKSTQDQRKREAHEREQRIAAEAQAKELANAQAKVWAEAEQRARESAQVNAERVTQQAELSRLAEKPARVKRNRKSFAWGTLGSAIFRLGIFFVVLLVGALFIIPYVFPLRDYIPKAQQLLSARLHQPVHIGYLSGRILPLPRLELGELYIGEKKQFQARNAQINFSLSGLFNDKTPISTIEFQEVKITAAHLQNVTTWLQQLANENRYPVTQMMITQGTLDADVFQLSNIEGELNFEPDGKFAHANLRTNAGKFTMGIKALPEEKLQIYILAHDTILPLLPNWSFDEITATGQLSKDEFQISDFDARILGGALHGSLGLGWRAGWRAQGTFTAKGIPMQKLSTLLDGNIDGDAHFQMTSVDLAGLIDSVALQGNFMANRGMISGMNIFETARMRSTSNLPGGRTPFEVLSGVISYTNNTYHFKQVEITAGVLNATAAFDVSKQQLSGKMSVSLSMSEGITPVVLQMGGAINDPTLRYAP
jgi:hypothetical protein